MELKKDGVLYKVAYGLSENPPTKTNLCQFFWRVVFMAFIGWPMALTLLVLLYSIASPFALFFWGYRPFLPTGSREPFEPISWWPKFRDGTNIAPVQILRKEAVREMLALLSIFSFIGFVVYAAYQVNKVATLGVVGSIILLIASVVVYSIARKSEWWQMTSEFIKAKKQKVCPLISFVDDPKN